MLRMIMTRRVVTGIALLIAVVTTAACAGSSTVSKPSLASRATSEASWSAAASRTYASKLFAIPVTVDVPPPLPVHADEDVPTFLTWVYQTDNNLSAVRMMLPAGVYPTAESPQQPPPPNAAAFVAYLHNAVAAGAIITDEKSMLIGGQAATVLTLSAQPNIDFDGLLGCPNTAAAAADCYGPGSDTLEQVAIAKLTKSCDSSGVALTPTTAEPHPSWLRSNQCSPDSSFARDRPATHTRDRPARLAVTGENRKAFYRTARASTLAAIGPVGCLRLTQRLGREMTQGDIRINCDSARTHGGLPGVTCRGREGPRGPDSRRDDRACRSSSGLRV